MAVELTIPHTKWKRELSSLQEHSTSGFHRYRQLLPEIKEWCKDYDIAYKIDLDNNQVIFRFEEDHIATLFKLTWL